MRLERIAEIREGAPEHLAKPLINELITAVEQLLATCHTDDLIIADRDAALKQRDEEIHRLKVAVLRAEEAAKYWEKRVRELGDDDV